MGSELGEDRDGCRLSLWLCISISVCVLAR